MNVVSDYIKLRIYLNRANKLAQSATVLRFSIEPAAEFTYRLMAIVDGLNEKQRIALAERGAMRTWERAGCTPFQALEEFCAEELNRQESLMSPSSSWALTDTLMKRLQDKLNEKIAMMLLNPGYEP